VTGVKPRMADAFDDSPVVIAELPQIKLFGKWSSEDVNHSDMSLAVSLSECSSSLSLRLSFTLWSATQWSGVILAVNHFGHSV